MSCWLTIPSKRPPEEAEPVLKQWRERGYKIALWRDDMDFPYGVVDYIRTDDGPYPGYAVACNKLVADLLATEHAAAEWFICGGDDVLPDPNHAAEEIAVQCSEHFYNSVELSYPPSRPQWADIPIPSPGGSGKDAPSWRRWSTFGVMQPTGDRWGFDASGHDFIPQTPGCDGCNCKQCGRREDSPNHLVGAYIDRVAGSPWIGREFARRMYQGRGPYWPEYRHQFVDQELQEVAIKMGVFWQRPDLIHFHQHWGRPQEGERIGHTDRMPAFLAEANSAPHWAKFKRIFEERKTAGFPGSEPL